MKKTLIYFFLIVLLVSIFDIFSILKKPIDIDIDNSVALFKNAKPIEVSVLNFGDLMFDRGVRNIIENRKRDPFEYIKKDLDVLNKYDVVVANLEGPVVVMDRNLCQQKAYNFQFATDTTDRLKSIGIKMVNIANNHSYDCYSKGFESTKKYLIEAGIDYTGDTDVNKSFVIKEINSKKVAFVGIDRTVSDTSIEKYYELVKKLKPENDFVVVDIHWGTEYSLLETQSQISVAHGLIDSGVDVIFGHHPHVVEPVRLYKNKAIFYSLGNFVFDQTGKEENTGIGAGVVWKDDLTKYTIHPFNIKLFAPALMKGEEMQKYCDKFLKDIEHSGCSFDIAHIDKNQ